MCLPFWFWGFFYKLDAYILSWEGWGGQNFGHKLKSGACGWRYRYIYIISPQKNPLKSGALCWSRELPVGPWLQADGAEDCFWYLGCLLLHEEELDETLAEDYTELTCIDRGNGKEVIKQSDWAVPRYALLVKPSRCYSHLKALLGCMRCLNTTFSPSLCTTAT